MEEVTKQEVVEQSTVETPKEVVKTVEKQPITMLPHIDNTYTFTFAEITEIKRVLAPFEFAISLINSTKQKVENAYGGMVPVFEEDTKKVNTNGTEQVILKDPENFWKKFQKLKGNAMKVENGELKSN